MQPVYLDYNATTPIDPEVAEAMLPYVREHFGNPSSSHVYGRTTRAAVDTARAQVAGLLGCSTDELVFTSGGTESNNHAIMGYAWAHKERGNHIITSAVEHPAVTEVCKHLAKQGFEITFLPVDRYGMVSPADFEKALTPRTILVTIMHANNEVGTIQPIAEIAAVAKKHGIAVHSDCAQSIGKVPVRVDNLGVDMLSLAGHKLYAPKGIGALYIRRGTVIQKLMHGADHESNRRPGTENVIHMVGLGRACQLISDNMTEHMRKLREYRDRLESKLTKAFPDAVINGHPEHRLPNTCSISFPRLEANKILSAITNVAASAGAACHSHGVSISSVLKAMAVPETVAMGTLRLSVGRFTTPEDIDLAVDDITAAVTRLRS